MSSYFHARYLIPNLLTKEQRNSLIVTEKDPYGEWENFIPIRKEIVPYVDFEFFVRIDFGKDYTLVNWKSADGYKGGGIFLGQFPTCCGLAEGFNLNSWGDLKISVPFARQLCKIAGYSSLMVTHEFRNKVLTYLIENKIGRELYKFYNRRSGNQVAVVEIPIE